MYNKMDNCEIIIIILLISILIIYILTLCYTYEERYTITITLPRRTLEKLAKDKCNDVVISS